MDYIKTSDISDPNIQMPWTGPIINFLLNIAKQANVNQAYSYGGDYLYNHAFNYGMATAGCSMTTSGNTIFMGYIFHQGELYFFPGAMGLLAYSNVPVVVVDETNDPTVGSVEFSDAVFRYVTKVRRLKVVDQLSGTGLFDLVNLGRLVTAKQIDATNTSTASGAATDITGSSYTSPNRTTKLKLTVQATLSFVEDNAVAEGATLILRNQTTSTNLQNQALQVGNGVTGGQMYGCVTFTHIIESVPANTTYKYQILRTGNNNVTAQSVRIQVEEIPKK